MHLDCGEAIVGHFQNKLRILKDIYKVLSFHSTQKGRQW